MSEQVDTVRTDELRPGDRIWHPFDIVPFIVAHTPKAETGLHFEGEPGLRVTGTDTRGETVHVDVAPGYQWHRAPITNVEDAVRELGALPVPVGVKPKPVDVEDQREQAQAWEGHILGAWDGEFAMVGGLDSAVLKLARMVQADLAEIESLRSRVTELEAERQSTNEALDDAVQALRASRKDGVYPQGSAQRVQQRDRDDVTPQVTKLRALLAGQREQTGGAR